MKSSKIYHSSHSLETIIRHSLVLLSKSIQFFHFLQLFLKFSNSFQFREKVDSLPVLSYLLEKGNTTYFEYRTGVIPDIVEEFKSTVCYTDENLSSDVGNDNVRQLFYTLNCI